MTYKPIRDYGLISDSQTAGLVGMDGSIDWLCWPRFDSPSIFGAILDDKKGGRFSISPINAYESSQEYIEDTNVLTTTFETETGRGEIVDFMPINNRRRGLYRVLAGVSGEIELEAVFAPRFDYGRYGPTIESKRGSIVSSWAGGALALTSQVPLEIQDETASGILRLHGGDKRILFLGDPGVIDLSPIAVDGQLNGAIRFWRSWLNMSPYSGPWKRAVNRSALTVKALTYQPTGLIVASPTASLPEKIGDSKNWDYRYAWLRDGAMVLEAMFHLGHMADEGSRFLKFLTEKGAGDPARLRIMYSILGEEVNGEQIVSELEGYMGSAPVRIGNDASNQFQLDVYGEVLLCAYRYVDLVGRATPGISGAIARLANFIVDNWRRPDMGIWEERGAARHYTHSKMMCAVGLQSALKAQKLIGFSGPTGRWKRELALIKKTIIERAYDSESGSFTKAFESRDLDAGALLMSVYNFLPAADPRLRSTADKIIHNLGHKGLIYRFRWGGEAPGASEGAFTIASIWLAIHFIKLNKLDFAADYIQAIVDSANHLGLLAEEIDAGTGDFLGNFPQLFVHTALIDAAHAFNTAVRAKVA